MSRNINRKVAQIVPHRITISPAVFIYRITYSMISIRAVFLFAVFLAGVWMGGLLFHDSQPRSLLQIGKCGQRCWRKNELAGLLASAGIQHLPSMLPEIVAQNDDCIAIRHPFDRNRKHFVVFPKRDMRNIADINEGDSAYIMACLAIVRDLVEREHMSSYRVWTNGPDKQDLTYLHFHLAEVDEQQWTAAR